MLVRGKGTREQGNTFIYKGTCVPHIVSSASPELYHAYQPAKFLGCWAGVPVSGEADVPGPFLHGKVPMTGTSPSMDEFSEVMGSRIVVLYF